MKAFKIYSGITGLLILILIIEGLLCSLSYIEDNEASFDDLNAILAIVSLMFAILGMSQLGTWFCCFEVTPFKLIACGNILIDLVMISTFGYLVEAITDESSDDLIFALKISSLILCSVRMLVMIFALYREIRQVSEIYPETEFQKVKNEKVSDIEMKNVFNENNKNNNFVSEINEIK